MKLPRRNFLHLAVVAAMPGASPIAWAQVAYPTRPVQWIVGFYPGSFPDIAARLLGQWLSERLGQQFVIENRPGAGGTIATAAVVHAEPDGYSLLGVVSAHAINATFYPKLKFNFIRDITPIASIGNTPLILVVNPSFPAKSVPEFIAYAKANPGKVNMGSAGTGSATHVTGELFKMMAGVDLNHVPYRGGFVPDLLGGQVQCAFPAITVVIEYIRAGTLRALAVTSATRSTTLPDIPTVGEFVPGYDSVGWFGVGAPKNISADIVDKLNREVNDGLVSTKLKAQLADVGIEPTPMTPADFGAFITKETEKWRKVIKAANILPE